VKFIAPSATPKAMTVRQACFEWPRHRGRTTWVWEVDHTDGEDRLVAVSRVTIAVRPRG
jgi:acyl-coenzyme A thioesterase PaaI-like protein